MKIPYSSIELLESRIAPASLVLMDLDGDKITFTASKAVLTASEVTQLTAPDGLHSYFDIDLSDAKFDHTDLSVKVSKGKNGDGQAIVGHVGAGPNDLGTVSIAGDLGIITAGSGTAGTPAIKSLTVNSFGRFGLPVDLQNFSVLNGNINSLVVKHDFIAANFYVTGNLLSVSIGGSVIGGPVAGEGQIYATGSIGQVTIKHDLRGGDDLDTGVVGAGVNIGTVTIGGSIYGGYGESSGDIFAAATGSGKITKVTVGGSVIGGDGQFSGQIGNRSSAAVVNNLALGAISIRGDLVGGSAPVSGIVSAKPGSLDSLVVKGSIVGGGNESVIPSSGGVFITGHIGRISVSGDLHGGAGNFSGAIDGDADIDTVIIGGSVIGGSGVDGGPGGAAPQDGGIIYAGGSLGKVTVGRDLSGGHGKYSGSIGAGVNIGSVKIGGSVYGGVDENTGDIYAAGATNGRIGSVTVGGSVIGGDGPFSGVLGGAPAAGAVYTLSLGTVAIGKDLVGGRGGTSGAVYAPGGSLDKVTVKGSLIGGASATGGITGFIVATGHAGTISILGSVYGGKTTGSGGIECLAGLDVLSIGGSLLGGLGTDSAHVQVAGGALGLLKIHGDVRGGAGDTSGNVTATAGITTKIIGGAVIPGTGPNSGMVS